MVQIIPQRSIEKGVVVFKLICDCGRDHDIAIKPSAINFRIDIVKKGKKVLPGISVSPNQPFKGRQVA